MRLKTYFASGVDAAMNMARAELGPDAMLVHSKRTSPENAGLGAFEVVFAVAGDLTAPSLTVPGTGSGTAPTSNLAASAASGGQPASTAVSSLELAGLREAVDLTLRLVRRSEALLAAQSKDGELADLASALEVAGFASEFRSKVLLGLRGLTGVNTESLRSSLCSWLLGQLRTQPQLGKPGAARKCVMLIGPPGSGKTTTLVKLAARYGVTGRRPAQILSLDTEKIGGAEGLRAYANVLGIGFQLLDSAYALGQALNEHSGKDLVLVDTPGMTAGQAFSEQEIAPFLASRSDIDAILVLAATTNAAVLKQQVAGFAAWSPSKLAFTRLDESGSVLGAMIETAIESGLPLSFCGTGQNTPEDLEPADAAAYCDRLAPEWLDGSALTERSHRAAA